MPWRSSDDPEAEKKKKKDGKAKAVKSADGDAAAVSEVVVDLPPPAGHPADSPR